MSESEACTCSLRARLHQMENARSREMEAHGKLVRQLESELESRLSSEGDLRLTVAKLRADKCRLEATLCAADAKACQLLEKLETERTKSRKREDELNTFRADSDYQLKVEKVKTDSLLKETRQLGFELVESAASLKSANHKIELLRATNEEHHLQTNSQVTSLFASFYFLLLIVCGQATAMQDLLNKLARKEQEIEKVSQCLELMLLDLTTSREQQKHMQEKIQELEREIDRALTTRNRAICWRRRRQEMWANQSILHSSFLAWISLSVKAKMQSVAKCNEDTRARLQVIKQEVTRRCIEAREQLSSARQVCASERTQIMSLRTNVVEAEIPNLMKLFEKQKCVFESRQKSAKLQLQTQQAITNLENERIGMLGQDAELRVQRLQAALQSHRMHLKLQQRSFLEVFAIRKRRDMSRRIFSSLKECYLRSTIGQATHTAMVFQSQHPQLSRAIFPNHVERTEALSRSMPSIRLDKPLQSRQQLNSATCPRFFISEPSTSIDTMWIKWRRVDGIRMVGRGRKQS